MYSILIVEDEEAMRKILKDYLIKNNYKVYEAKNGKIGLDTFYENKIDLILLDIMLPEYDGWSICRKIRQDSNVPIIMITARDEDNDQVFGLELGADEYVTKPFSPKVLVAKISALLRRVKNSDDNKGKLKLNNLEIDKKSYKVTYDDELLSLPPREYDLLIYLCENINVVLSREHLLNKVWGYDFYGDLRTVDTHIKKLRKKLNGNFIKTVRGVGYRFEVLK